MLLKSLSFMLWTVLSCVPAWSVELAQVEDPENGIKNPALKKASASTASIRTENGFLRLHLDPKLAQRRVDIGEGKKQSIELKDLLSGMLGALPTFQEEGRIVIPFDFSPEAEIVVRALMKEGHIQSGDFEWKAIGTRASLDSPGGSDCTSFLVYEDIFFTNHHCMSSQLNCDIAKIRFNEELDYKADPENPVVKNLETYNCKKLLISDRELDFAAFRVDGVPDSEAHPAIKLRLQAPKEGSPSHIIGHPGMSGMPKGQNTLKRFSSGKLMESFRMTEADPVRYYDLDKLFSDFQLLESEKDQMLRTIPVYAASLPGLRGMSGSAALNDQGEAYGLFFSVVEWKAVERAHNGDASETGSREENLDTALSISLRAIHQKHGATLERLGVKFER